MILFVKILGNTWFSTVFDCCPQVVTCKTATCTNNMAKSVLGVEIVEKDLLELMLFCLGKPVVQIQPPLRAVCQSLNSECDSLEEQ